MEYKINGTFKLGREIRNYDKTVKANSEAHAKDMLYAIIGHQNGLRRSQIKIDKIIVKKGE